MGRKISNTSPSSQKHLVSHFNFYWPHWQIDFTPYIQSCDKINLNTTERHWVISAMRPRMKMFGKILISLHEKNDNTEGPSQRNNIVIDAISEPSEWKMVWSWEARHDTYFRLSHANFLYLWAKLIMIKEHFLMI